MCLHEVKFALKFDNRTKTYYGEGWKCFEKNGAGELMNYNGKIPPVKRWTECSFTHGACDDVGNDYVPGFHIFLTKEDAELYTDSECVIVPVQFREVLAYGTNLVYGEKRGEPYRNCVIARYIKVDSYDELEDKKETGVTIDKTTSGSTYLVNGGSLDSEVRKIIDGSVYDTRGMKVGEVGDFCYTECLFEKIS